MTTDMLGPIAGLDAAKAYKRYFGSLAKTRDHNGLDFGLVIDSAVMLSVETLWPSILKLSRRAVAGDIAAADGWTIKSVSTGDAGDSAFVMENDELPGGFLFNCRFRIERIAEVDKEVVSGVMCCAYRGDGLFPPGYSGFGDDLDETVKIGFDGGKCQSGQIFSYRPSVHLQLMGPNFGKILVNPSSPVSDPAIAIQSLATVGNILLELGYDQDIDDRAGMIGELSLDHTKTAPADIALIEMGAGSLTDGVVAERMIGLCHHFWAQAASLDMERVSSRLAKSIEVLASSGYTAPDNVFRWKDDDKSAFVVRSSDGAMVWIETQQTAYRIDVRTDNESNGIMELSAAMVANGKTTAARPTPRTRGYLGEFVREEIGSGFSIYEIGEMTTTNIRGMNGLVSAIEHLADRLEAAATPEDAAAPSP